MSLSIREIIREYLVANGYEGLVNADAECGCDLEDLMACSEPGVTCKAAYRYDCTKCDLHSEEYNSDCPMGGNHDYAYVMSEYRDFC